MKNPDPIFEALLAALKERLAIVADHEWRDRDAAGHLEGLKAAAGRLDALVSNLPAGIDPTLRHYLERQSFTKARDWLVDELRGNS
ncbi:MAG: hypothetical protein ACKOAS_10980 [Verrucomicrobiota bacterium]